MKTIGIIGAMEEEISIFKSRLNIIATRNIIDVDFYIGKLHENNVVIARSGIGKVNAAACAQILIDKYGAEIIINVGVAGSLNPEVKIGDVVISTDTAYYDFDCSDIGDEIGLIPRMNRKFFPADENLVSKSFDAAKDVCIDKNVFRGRIVSGDRFVGKNSVKAQVLDIYPDALCCDMEGTAIGHVSFINKVPFVVIRSISDTADDSAEVHFEQFVDEMARNAAALVDNLIKSL
ncbi:MAG: 5'-methylthioadenosine/adenosylhomocysteine nucleosidase [Clostridiales bacterium]|jgi:adenosylhomocysteine nucleosidase|nr:5'-methylthioadenosine/adenosylhomocysteine nucleosidase [Clostridiales bacterium]